MSTVTEGNPMVEAHERLYAIKPDEGYFFAGVSSDGGQALVGLFCPNLASFHFDREGKLLTREQRPVACFQGVTPPYDIYDARIQPMIEAWQQQLGFRPATIRVRKFWSPEHCIGIEDYPSHFHEILADAAADEEAKVDVRESMKLWDQDGQFVLQWGNDYWLDGSGRVVSS